MARNFPLFGGLSLCPQRDVEHLFDNMISTRYPTDEALSKTLSSGMGEFGSNLNSKAIAYGARRALYTMSEGVAVVPQWLGFTARHARRNGVDADDSVSFSVDAGDGQYLVMGALLHREESVGAREGHVFRQIAAHTGAALRLRTRLGHGIGLSPLEQADAVIDGNGRLVDARDATFEARTRGSLRDAALAWDRAQCRSGQVDREQALALWQGLLQGRWSFLDYLDSDGRPLLLVFKNEVPGADPRALSVREVQVLHLLGRGLSNKHIALDLEMTEPTVSHHLHRALRKLGMSSLTRLSGLVRALDRGRADGGALGGAPGFDGIHVLASRSSPNLELLTESETRVIQLILSGRSAGDVARHRGVSVKTVNNQLFSIYAKLGVHSAREICF